MRGDVMGEEQQIDIGDQYQSETRAKRVKLARKRRDGDFVAMMEVPGFRAFVWRLLGAAHVFETSIGADPHQTSFREGERNIGLMLWADVARLCPRQFPLMAAEAAKRDEDLHG